MAGEIDVQVKSGEPYARQITALVAKLFLQSGCAWRENATVSTIKTDESVERFSFLLPNIDIQSGIENDSFRIPRNFEGKFNTSIIKYKVLHLL